MTTNKRARLYGEGDLRIEESPMPEPGENEVRVKMAFVGMCRSDVHFYDEGRIDRYIVKQPLTLGHEMSGTVDKLGPGVTDLKPGDRVSIDPNRPCMKCRYCLRKKYNICDTLSVAGIPQTDGGYAHYMITPASCCVKLPDHLSLEAGACLEPLSIGVHGLERAQMVDGDVVVVIGAGPIGLYAMQAAKAKGASKVLIADILPARLELAKELGADVTHQSGDLTNPSAAAENIKKALGDEADLVIECSGANGAVDTAIHTCRPAGKVLMLGFGEMAMHLHVGMAAVREIDIIGSVCNSKNFPECMELVASGKVKVTPIITHMLTLDKIKDALDLVRSGGKSIKVMIDCQK